MPVQLSADLDPAAQIERTNRLIKRRFQYRFEDREPLAPIPMMKPLSVSHPRQMRAMKMLSRVHKAVKKTSGALLSSTGELLSALVPDFIEDPSRTLLDRLANTTFDEQLCRTIERFSQQILDEIDPDPADLSAVEHILEIVFSLLDREDESPYPYNDLIYAMFDLPTTDMIDDLFWRPSFPGADPDGLYINVRNNDLLGVQGMGRRMRREINFNPDINAERRFPDLDTCARFFPEPELCGTDATGAPRGEPRALRARLLDDDFEFAWQRLAGANPVVLQRLLLTDAAEGRGGIRLPLASWPDLDASEQVLEMALHHVVGTNRSLAVALEQGRLFVVDYPEILAAEPGHGFDEPRIFAPTIALFYADPEQGLLPLAIRLNQGSSARVYTPLEAGQQDQPWRTAKLFFQVADLIHHEVITHLLESHFVLEGIAITARRQLDIEHPVYVLLHAHLRGVLFNLMVGRRLLLAKEQGMVDMLFPLQTGQWVQIVQEGYRRWKAEDLYAPGIFTRQGTDDASALPEYPYRDDAMLLWSAIETYVEEYLAIFYTTSASVLDDPELTAWRQELLRVYSQPMPGEAPERAQARAAGFDFSTRDGLSRLLTGILFTSGPRHAAVNFAQWDYMMFVGNTPAAAYTNDSDTLPPAEQALPTIDQIVNQMEVISLLAGRQFGRLGHYPEDEFSAEGDLNQLIQSIILRFQESLVEIGIQIDARNSGSRTHPFPYLHPDFIPNSANV